MFSAGRVALFCFLCGVLTGHCAAEKQGRLELAGTNVVAFGTYPNTEERTAHVQVKNAGEGPLQIVRVVATCKCMRVDAYPRVLAPGETGEVAVAILKNEVAGAFDRVFFIESDGRSNRSVKVRITGFARPLFRVTCDAVTSLGPVAAGHVWTGHYTVAATETGLLLGAPSVQNRGARCDYTIRTNQQEKIVYEVTQAVTFEGEGPLESALVFPVLRKAGGSPLPVRLAVEAFRKRPINVVPDRIQIPQASVPFKRRLLLTVDAQTPLEPSKLSWKTELEGVEILPQVARNGKSLLLLLTFPAASPSAVSRTGRASIVFHYGDWSVGVPVQPEPRN
jgi:hypothetical protein